MNILTRRCATSVTIFCNEAFGRHLTLMPIHAAPMLDRQRFGRLLVRDDFVDLSATQRALECGAE
jgi:hypothetical protein